jgi:transposase-like protein
MKNTKIKQLISTIPNLSVEDILSLDKAVKSRIGQLDSSIIIKNKSDSIKACPDCGSINFKKIGIRNGKQRFKCNESECGRTFTPLTNTPFARLRLLDKHVANARCMIEGLTVRAAADAIGVHRNTAFRWRHRFLRQIETIQPTQLNGIVEADETFFRESFKGQKTAGKKGGNSAKLWRKAKKRGTPAEQRGLSREQIPVLVARDRAMGKTLSRVIASTSSNDIGSAILPILACDAELISDSAPAYRKMAKKHGIYFRVVPKNKKHKTSGALHINNVNAYDSRLKGWMVRFRGVATKYLSNYLGWHRLLDEQVNGKKMPPKKFLTVALG